MRDTIEIKKRIIEAGYKAVEELIKVAEENILNGGVEVNEEGEAEYSSLAADRLKNAAAAKKTAIFDAFEILNRIEAESESIKSIEDGEETKVHGRGGFAEGRASTNRK